MDISKIYYCRECRPSHHLRIKNLKNSFLERSSNLNGALQKKEISILEDYAMKNIVKKHEHFTVLSRMATETKKEWQNGRTLTVSFIGGNKQVKDRIIRHAKTWMEYANINFDFTPRKKPGDIRISFRKDGSWSYLGTEILSIPKSEPTMNFGWLTPTLNDIEFHQVVMHEFGHTLGCIHEHERPDNGIPWDKPKVYAYYAASDDGWTKDEVDEQVFGKYDISQLRTNKLDKDSIMMYSVPDKLTIGNFSIDWNPTLSKADKKFIAKLYPKKK